MRQILKTYFGYDSFRLHQQEIIRHVCAGGDALVLMPTGGGKSICFQVPALAMTGVTIVISPLISLMKDQVDALKANGVRAEALNSANSESQNDEIHRRCQSGEVRLLYVSPERFLAEEEWFRHAVRVSLIAVDEAHCISQWGHDFRSEYTQLGHLHDSFPETPIMALTATADKITRQDILEQLHMQHPRIFISSFDRPNLSLDVRRGYSAKDRLRTIMQVIARHPDESGIIYCLSRKTTEKVAGELCSRGVRVGVYHAGMSTADRDRVQEEFLGDHVQVVCATIAFGMGIDKSNVRFVIHYNLPRSIENFYQEIGRGGRDGLLAETILFYNLQDLITLRKFADESGQIEINHEKLTRMQEYAEAQVCRRRILLNYFGEPNDGACNNCDVCHNPPQRFDGTLLVQKALSAIRRAEEHIGLVTTIHILRGTMSSDVVVHGYHQIRTFAAGRDIPYRDWQDYMLQMLQMGFLEIDYREDKHLHVTPLGEEVLYGRRPAELALVEKKDFRVKKKGREKATPQLSMGMGIEDAELFDSLKKLRREVAEENGWAAYIVMSDKTLHALATEKPLSQEAFGNVYGIGERKKRDFGERFVALIRKHEGLDY
ncbi:MAG: DNA helicase RecQ [Bacteroidaceae bacterium]